MEKRNIVMQLLGCLMKNPLFLGEVNTYNLTPNDFSKTMDKQIFAAIYNLFKGGAEKVTVVDVDNYLKGHPAIYSDFVKNNGIEYLQDAEDFGVLENFSYYYTTLKKYNAIKDLQKEGFDTSDIYPTDMLDPNQEDKLKKFDSMTIQMIFENVRSKLVKIEGEYNAGTNTKVCYANEGIDALLDGLAASPEIGVNLPGETYNTIVRGARKGKFYLQSSGTGVGKTRRMVGECSYIAYPIRYDWTRRQWEKRGSCEKVLYVGTEQTISEIQTLILAYISGINEEKILYGRYNDEERKVLEDTLKIMEIYKENFTIVQLPDPSIQLVKGTIRKECLLKEIGYVFYDYIFSSPGLLAEFRDLRIREDVALGMLSTALKDLAVELDVFMRSATQVNGDLQEIKGIRDQRCIRGAKAIADKIDCGMVTVKVNPDELITLDKLIREKGICPNQVSDIYKMRRGRYNDVRIWSEMDLGTCRIKDLFVTDVNFKPLIDFYPISISYEECDDEIQSLLDFLNEKDEEQVIKVETPIVEVQPTLELENVNLANPNNWVF
jgi:replicative DNA helicase